MMINSGNNIKHLFLGCRGIVKPILSSHTFNTIWIVIQTIEFVY